MKKPSLIFTRSKNRREASGRTAAAALLFGCVMAFSAAGYAAADFSGVWVVTSYSPEIKSSDGKSPPLLPKAAHLYSQRKALLAKGDASFDIVMSRCGPPGMPRVMLLPYAFEIVQNTHRLAFLFEWNRLSRRVDVDAPSLSANDLQWSGRAVGHWDGDTMVIKTTQIDDSLLDAAGMPHSPELIITERLHLLNDGTLESRVRFEDAKTFSAPWETTVTYRKLPKGTEVGEDICLDRFKTTPAIVDNNYLHYPK